MDKKLLLIFVKNPEKGKVKTRLAKTVGNDKAYNTYLRLLDYTMKVAAMTEAQKQIWYSSFIDHEDGFESQPTGRPKHSGGSVTKFEKKLQRGENLGARMQNAFQDGFKGEYGKIVIIGSDCPGITSEIIEEAFTELDGKDVVIGPSEDGGYYLLGLKKMIPGIFEDISWSTEDVFSETVKVLKNEKMDYGLLPTLNDIDTEEDLRKSDFE
ncbi:TIGR04282 family arsenosugar biosynthesis glycosyltransferase [Rhodohalobacter sulfatireducens]|uniref:TIGR04282 family arsenosugar biosynthesis glycosyltransferase n=1 Tax=Rhodohalobacter sulfatireducens TaxID=2911366 RepID=A0ABS9KCB9_9BACT|nr:TIGR04282 family arsenosugar biosynthesis glycosyltransferase [Rhodohalobacter sulfatireducens]MCG2588507.1 TIGR04282 family arsenosugar biosynthesis glycosyltransferase [Rhodohalobacter sulfatireducens]